MLQKTKPSFIIIHQYLYHYTAVCHVFLRPCVGADPIRIICTDELTNLYIFPSLVQVRVITMFSGIFCFKCVFILYVWLNFSWDFLFFCFVSVSQQCCDLCVLFYLGPAAASSLLVSARRTCLPHTLLTLNSLFMCYHQEVRNPLPSASLKVLFKFLTILTLVPNYIVNLSNSGH